VRISSYLDGMKITPQESEHFTFNGSDSQPATQGITYLYSRSGVIRQPVSGASPQLTAWDTWVTIRVAQRAAAMQTVMQQAGLKTPLPGLADLAGQGTFVACAPYGTCWQPANGWTPPQSATATATATAPAQIAGQTIAQTNGQPAPIRPLPEAQATPTANQATPATMKVSTVVPRTSGIGSPLTLYEDDDFPCSPWRVWYRRSLSFYPDSVYPFDWAVCHAGFWINRQHRFLWVVGTHRHHRCPVHWVKYQGKLAYVPAHPRDQRGQLPLNLRHGIYALVQKPGQPGRQSIERLALDGKSPPRVLDATPKDFRSPAPPLLARADSPQLGVHFMHESPHSITAGAPAHSAASSRSAGSSLVFDQHSNRFLLATRVTEGGRTHTFTAPMSDRGGHIASSSAGGYHPGFSGSGYTHAGGYSGNGGHTSGGNAGGHSGGGFSGGGGGTGFHGGGSSGGGSGFHSGESSGSSSAASSGGASSAGPSSAGPSSSAASSGGGGGRH
jgi:hypothetical protein